MVLARRFGVGAGGGDHGDVALCPLTVAVKMVRSFVCDFATPFSVPLPPGTVIADENAE